MSSAFSRASAQQANQRGINMFGFRFLAPTAAVLSAAALLLPSGPAVAQGYRGGANQGYLPGYFSGFPAGYTGGYYNGRSYSNPGLYYPGYFSRSGGYYAPSYSPPVYYTPPSAAYISGGYRGEVGPADQAPGPPPPDGTAAVGVHVPADAEVFFNDAQTKQSGEQREFVTPTLPVGRAYQYDVRARWKENGKEIDRTRTITVHANQRAEVDFTQPEQEKVGAPK